MTNTAICNTDCLSSIQTITEGTIDLAVCDPPYFKVVNEKWDYSWRTINDYLEWCEEWLPTLATKVRYGGSLYIFGYFRNLAGLISIAENAGLELRQQIIVDKGLKSIAGRKTSTYKMFPNTTESILFFVRDNKKFIKPLLRNRANELGLSAKEINERLGVKSNGGGMWSIYTGRNVCEQFPTKQIWERLMDALDLCIPYQALAQTFNPIKGLSDVWTDIEFYFSNRIHPTEKPLKLMERLVNSSSNPGDVVLDPFSGSGATALACARNQRKSISFEIDPLYWEASLNRLAFEGFNDVDTVLHGELVSPYYVKEVYSS